MNKKSFVLTSLLIVFVLIVGFIGGGVIYLYSNVPESDKYSFGDFNIHVMQLGNQYTGDCIYIKSGETDILIDAGSRGNSASVICEYLDNYVEDNKLEYVIATHGDQDHISAFAGTTTSKGILYQYDVDIIIDFPLTNKDTSSSSSVISKYYTAVDYCVSQGSKHYNALECFNEENGAKRIYQISDGVEMEILYNYYYDHSASDENNYSVCIMFNQGDNHYLFTGDIEKEGEEHLVEYYTSEGRSLPQCIFYKSAHHGSKTSNTTQLLDIIRPEYVVVCACAGTPEYTSVNENMFPTQEFIDNIAPYTDKIYIPSVVDTVSDDKKSWTVKEMNGNIIFSAKNDTLVVTCSNNNLILKDTDWFKNNRVCPKEWA